MSREIRGLQWVELAENPWGRAPRRPKGVKGLGLRFEATVAKALPGALHGQWFKFLDNNGPGYAQADLLFEADGRLCLGECKLTDCFEADRQMKRLYLPLLQALWDGPIHCIVIVKYLSPLTERGRVVSSWDSAMAHSAPVLHAFSKRELAPPKGQIFSPTFSRACHSIADSVSYA